MTFEISEQPQNEQEALPVELANDTLYRLGGHIMLDGNVSWRDGTIFGSEPVNCYLIRANKSSALVDTGIRAHRDQVIHQLKSTLPTQAGPSIFLTRAEADCMGNFGSLASAFQLPGVYAGGNQNPLDFFEDVGASAEAAMANQSVKVTRLLPGSTLEVAPGSEVEVVATPLRLLTTFWAYYLPTKTLFTSDTFGHGHNVGAAGPVTVDSGGDIATVDSVRQHLLTKFDWLARATRNVGDMRDGLQRIFEERDIEIVAPTHGRILYGKDVVMRHYGLVQDVLRNLP